VQEAPSGFVVYIILTVIRVLKHKILELADFSSEERILKMTGDIFFSDRDKLVIQRVKAPIFLSA